MDKQQRLYYQDIFTCCKVVSLALVYRHHCRVLYRGINTTESSLIKKIYSFLNIVIKKGVRMVFKVLREKLEKLRLH